jgi:hypothetical protein
VDFVAERGTSLKMLKWTIATILAVVLACVAAFVVWAWPALYVPPVRDFVLTEVQFVDRAEFRPCATNSITCLPSLPYDRMLRVRLASDRNLVEHAVRHNLLDRKEVWSCSTDPDRYAAGEFIAPGPYADEQDLPYGSRASADEFYAATGKWSGSRLSYDIYLVPRWNEISNAYEGTKERAPPYDVSDGRDICLRIVGGNMLGGRFVGNTVRVTSAEIQAAMSEG